MNGGYNGVTGWLDDLGTELKRRGVEVSYWFGTAPPARVAAFERIGRTRVGPAAALVGALAHERYDVVHVHTADGLALAPTLPDIAARLIATNHASVSRLWNSGNSMRCPQ